MRSHVAGASIKPLLYFNNKLRYYGWSLIFETSVIMSASGERVENPTPQAAKKQPKKRLLVIKHGSRGSFAMITGALKTIRHHYAKYDITLLTTHQNKSLAEACPYIDEIWLDPLPGWFDIDQIKLMRKRFSDANFKAVYDLEHSPRTRLYFRLCGRKKPDWCGPLDWCSHPYDYRAHLDKHVTKRLALQLAETDVDRVAAPDISWLGTNIDGLQLPQSYAVLAIGGRQHNPLHEWHSEGFSQVAEYLSSRKILPIIVGNLDYGPEAKHIMDGVFTGKAKNMVGKLTALQQASLAKNARIVVGHDVGVAYFAGLQNVPILCICSSLSDPANELPEGKHVQFIKAGNLSVFAPADVIRIVEAMLGEEEKNETAIENKTETKKANVSAA